MSWRGPRLGRREPPRCQRSRTSTAGVTYPLIDKSCKPDAAAGAVTDGLTPANLNVPYLTHFPYLGVPHSGFTTPST